MPTKQAVVNSKSARIFHKLTCAFMCLHLGQDSGIAGFMLQLVSGMHDGRDVALHLLPGNTHMYAFFLSAMQFDTHAMCS